MNLEIEVKSNAAIATNVKAVSEFYIAELQKYKGCVATPETLKDDKKSCTNINKLKKFVSEQRIAFDKEVNNQPDVKAVHDALKAIEDECDKMRTPYWESCKAIEDANKEPEETFSVEMSAVMTAKQIEKVKKFFAKEGIALVVKDMAMVK